MAHRMLRKRSEDIALEDIARGLADTAHWGIAMPEQKENTKRVSAMVQRLVQDAEWVLQFLEQYPPHFSDGKSMETDLGDGLHQLQEAVDDVKKHF